MVRMAPLRAALIMLFAIRTLAPSALPLPGSHRRQTGRPLGLHGDADTGVADEVAGGADVAHVRAPADEDAGGRCILDDVAGDDAIGLDRDALAALVVGLVLAAHQIANEVALHDGEAAAVIEVGDGNARRGGVDEVVGDQRALESRTRRTSATSPSRAQLLPIIWMLEAALPRTAL